MDRVLQQPASDSRIDYEALRRDTICQIEAEQRDSDRRLRQRARRLQELVGKAAMKRGRWDRWNFIDHQPTLGTDRWHIHNRPVQTPGPRGGAWHKMDAVQALPTLFHRYSLLEEETPYNDVRRDLKTARASRAWCSD
jgi:hypothetical protein